MVGFLFPVVTMEILPGAAERRMKNLGRIPIELEFIGVFAFVNLDCPCRDAAVEHDLIATVCRSPTGYFCIGTKVPKNPPKGFPLGYPLFAMRVTVLFSAREHRMGESFAPLTRSCGCGN